MSSGLREVWWLGVNNPEAMSPVERDQANALADAARDFRWITVLELLGDGNERVNSARPGGSSGYAPLHQAAHGGAPLEVVQALIARGAFRTLRTVVGEQPVDIARRMGHLHLLEILEPQAPLKLPPDKLTQVEAGVHQVIQDREGVRPLLERCSMRLPPLEILTEIPEHRLWFPVPGMYGGFHIQLGRVADEPLCVVDSWCRVVGGSEERRLVSTGGILPLYIPLS